VPLRFDVARSTTHVLRRARPCPCNSGGDRLFRLTVPVSVLRAYVLRGCRHPHERGSQTAARPKTETDISAKLYTAKRMIFYLALLKRIIYRSRIAHRKQPELTETMRIPRGFRQHAVAKLVCIFLNASFLVMVSPAWAGTPYLTNLVASRTTSGVVVSFRIGGGTNDVPLNMFQASSLGQSLWPFLGIGFASNVYTFSNQPSARAFYTLGPPPVTMVVAWGDDLRGQTDLPFITNAIAVAGGYDHSLALQSEGSVLSWGYPGTTENQVPTSLPLVQAIGAGWNHNVALLHDGTVTNWGLNGAEYGYHLTEMPAGLTNVSALAVGALHSLALRRDGTVVAWGYNADGQTNVPSGLSNVVAIAAGGAHSLALKNDGTVSGWGNNY